jgi:hypothetical protein
VQGVTVKKEKARAWWDKKTKDKNKASERQ